MFSSRGLFSTVPCPGTHNCTLPNCLFMHDHEPQRDISSNEGQVYDPASAMPPGSPPPMKRRRLDSDELMVLDDMRLRQSVGHKIQSSGVPDEVQITSMTKPNTQSLKRTFAESSVNGATRHASSASPAPALLKASASQSANGPPVTTTQPASITRTVSPPATNRPQKHFANTLDLRPHSIKDEPFNARRIDHNPVQYGERDKKLKLFYKQLESKQQKLRTALKDEPGLVLSEKELKKVALDEEEQVAKAASNSDTYTNRFKDRLTFYLKMDHTAYKEWVIIFRTPTIVQAAKPALIQTPTEIKSGLDHVEKEVAILKHLRTGLHQHAKHGYVIKAPSELEMAKARAAQDGWENCDRCSTRFKVFRGRNSEGQLTTRGPCQYHWGRMPLRRGTAAGVYSCCQQELGTTGCETSEHHVFKVSDPARLASLLQFETTPAHKDGKKRGPVVFDCEMGYTTCGLELIRVTALSWPTKQTLLDVLVRPIGEVLDLNTRFSGVTSKLYYNAPDYGSFLPKYTPGEQLQKVASPAGARALLFELLDPDTPLIGHAIDNDLNTCRIIHPFVIDTVLLYPHPRGLPIRYKLRDLASKYLGRVIQSGGAGGSEGHDSKEDSEATGDLARVKVKEKWEQYKALGWYWNTNTLMPPKGKAAIAQTLLSSP